jgi:hypothetical protein
VGDTPRATPAAEELRRLLRFLHPDEESSALRSLDAALRAERLATARRLLPALSLARSMILSGEPMSQNAAAVFDEAFSALDEVGVAGLTEEAGS